LSYLLKGKGKDFLKLYKMKKLMKEDDEELGDGFGELQIRRTG
jgi:hypothetical protein